MILKFYFVQEKNKNSCKQSFMFKRKLNRSNTKKSSNHIYLVIIDVVHKMFFMVRVCKQGRCCTCKEQDKIENHFFLFSAQTFFLFFFSPMMSFYALSWNVLRVLKFFWKTIDFSLYWKNSQVFTNSRN